MQEGRRNEIESSERASGDLFGYFLLHNLISVMLFFLFTISLGIYIKRDVTFVYLISPEFWQLTMFQIFPCSVISSILGRVTAFYIIGIYHKHYKKTTTNRWSELNRGINRMGLRFVITALIVSIIYTAVSITALSDMIFDEKALLPLMVTYFLLKTATYLSVRWLCGAKL